MTSFTITVQDQEVHAILTKLSGRVGNMQPNLQAVGEDMVERIKHRFDTSSAPDGAAWAPNAQSTLQMLADRLGKSYRKKSGALNARGNARLAGKKPLIGESGQLRMQIVALAAVDALTVSTTSVTSAYAAIQHFGGRAGRNHSVNIPARPFMPIQADGTLYPSEKDAVLASINEFLFEGL